MEIDGQSSEGETLNFDEYKNVAKERGALAFELFIVTSMVENGSRLKDVLPDHLAYQAKLEASGALMLAGPMSDTDGHEVVGGCIILRAENMDAARALADADPMHSQGVRKYEIRRWLINEGGFTLRVGFGGGEAKLI